MQTAFESALYKIKSVLKRSDQEHLDNLSPHVDVSQPRTRGAQTGGLINTIQQAIGQQHVLALCYESYGSDAGKTPREVEPVGLYHYGMAWHLIAFCRTRQDYRDFRVDRIRQLTDTGQPFARHNRLTLKEYINQQACTDMPVENVTVTFEKTEARYIGDYRHNWGFVSEEDLGDCIRMHFQTPYVEGMTRWLLSYGKAVTVEAPEFLQARMRQLAEEIQEHYLGIEVT